MKRPNSGPPKKNETSKRLKTGSQVTSTTSSQQQQDASIAPSKKIPISLNLTTDDPEKAVEKATSPDENLLNMMLITAAMQGKSQTILSLINKGANIETTDAAMQATPLYWATYAGHLPTVMTLLEQDANINAQNKFGNTPLLIAVTTADSALLTILLENNASTEIADGFGNTPLMIAILNKDLEKIDILLKYGANVNARNSIGETILHLAIRRKLIDTIANLIEKGAELEVPDQHGDTALLLACTYLYDKGLIEVLINAGANTETTNHRGDTPLVLAALSNNLPAMQLLINSGVNIDFPSEVEGDTPLIAATVHGNIAAAKLLLQNRAAIETVNKQGDTALTLAVRYKQPELVEILIAYGANLEAKNILGQTAFLVATNEYQFETMRQLLDAGADIDATDLDGDTALHYLLSTELLSNDNVEKYLQLLLQRQAKTSIYNHDRRTVLHYAANNFVNQDIVQLVALEATKKGKNRFHYDAFPAPNGKIARSLLPKEQLRWDVPSQNWVGAMVEKRRQDLRENALYPLLYLLQSNLEDERHRIQLESDQQLDLMYEELKLEKQSLESIPEKIDPASVNPIDKKLKDVQFKKGLSLFFKFHNEGPYELTQNIMQHLSPSPLTYTKREDEKAWRIAQKAFSSPYL